MNIPCTCGHFPKEHISSFVNQQRPGPCFVLDCPCKLFVVDKSRLPK